MNLEDRHVTDLGPGNGASLSVFRSRGAKTYFVERNPALYFACRLRGFQGRLGNFLVSPRPVPHADIIYVRGSITASNFDSRDHLASWLDALGGSLHILCPMDSHTQPPKWFGDLLDERYARVAILGYQPPLYPHTWVSREYVQRTGTASRLWER
jgi:hypothetical protein